MRINDYWSMDFMVDELFDGQALVPGETRVTLVDFDDKIETVWDLRNR